MYIYKYLFVKYILIYSVVCFFNGIVNILLRRFIGFFVIDRIGWLEMFYVLMYSNILNFRLI